MHKQKIHNMLENLVTATEAEISKGLHAVDTHELMAAVDMIKDLCEAEKDCWKKCYYESIVEAMKEEEEYEEHLLKQMIMEHGEVEGRAGYDRWRNAKGRFAKTGHGHETSIATATGHHGRMGYDPNIVYDHDMGPWDTVRNAGVMGYVADGMVHSGSMAEGTHADSHAASTTGSHYDKYRAAKRHYHESGEAHHKQAMTEHGKQHVEEAILTMRDIFQDADPQMQQRMKNDLANLYREFGGK